MVKLSRREGLDEERGRGRERRLKTKKKINPKTKKKIKNKVVLTGASNSSRGFWDCDGSRGAFGGQRVHVGAGVHRKTNRKSANGTVTAITEFSKAFCHENKSLA